MFCVSPTTPNARENQGFLDSKLSMTSNSFSPARVFYRATSRCFDPAIHGSAPVVNLRQS